MEVKMKKQNKSMISMMHRLVNYCGKYKTSIRSSYLPGIVKGFLIKSPLVVTFFMACDFMAARMTKEKCLIFGMIILGCVVLQAVLPWRCLLKNMFGCCGDFFHPRNCVSVFIVSLFLPNGKWFTIKASSLSSAMLQERTPKERLSANEQGILEPFLGDATRTHA